MDVGSEGRENRDGFVKLFLSVESRLLLVQVELLCQGLMDS